MLDKALKLLGLMRRANAVQIGEEKTGNASRGGTAFVVLVAKDASDNARHRADGFAAGKKLPVITMPFTKAEISAATGAPGCSMAAVTDSGFADALMRILAENLPEEYSGAAAEIHERHNTQKRSKSRGKPVKRNKNSKEDCVYGHNNG